MRARFAFVVCLLACSNQDQSSDGGVDASVDVAKDVTADAPPPQDAGSDADAECNMLTNIGTVVPQTFVATDAVTGDGGTVVPGTYVLTAAAIYTGADGGAGPTGTSYKDTLALADGGTYERVASVIVDGGSNSFRQNGYFVLNGSSIQVKQTCPMGSQPFTSYDSNGSKLHIYAPGVMFEYTKQ